MIKVYTKTGCPYCKRKMEEFDRDGVDYEEINIFEVDGAKEELLKITKGQRMVPVIVDGKSVTIAPEGG